jgi:subtilisin family serine protease
MKQTIFAVLWTVLALSPSAFSGLASGAESCGEAYVCREALLRFSRHAGEADIQAVLQEAGATVIKFHPRSRIYHVSLSETRPTLEQIERLRNTPLVLSAMPNAVVTGDLLPDDPLFPNQWGLKNTGLFGGTNPWVDIGMEEVWDTVTGSPPLIIAVIDSGVDYTHPDLTANMWTNPGEIPGNSIDDDGNGFIDDVHGYDFFNDDGDPFDDHFHGTHVAGILGAVGNNGLGVTGVNWSARIMAVKFLGDEATGTIAGGIAAIEYAVANGARVLNNSWSTFGPLPSLFSAVLDSDAAGTVFVAAAGNDGFNNDIAGTKPASFDVPNIVSVASITPDDALSDFSSFGAVTVDLGAPGSTILSTFPTWWFAGDDDYAAIDGTSMATPHVAGLAALLWAHAPQLSHRQVVQALLQGVVAKDYLNGITVTGGVLNAPNSLSLVQDIAANHAPVADAGPDQFREIGETVTLSGSATDEDGDEPLVFAWSLQVPNGSTAQLDAADIPNPNFVVDVAGSYTATLTVSDAFAGSVPDSMQVVAETEVIPPPNVVILVQDSQKKNVAENNGVPSVKVGEAVFLNGAGTTGPFPDALLFEWSFIERPDGSQAELQNSTQVLSSFTPDLPGTYTVRLIAEDGHNESFGDRSMTAAQEEQAATAQAAGGCALVKVP